MKKAKIKGDAVLGDTAAVIQGMEDNDLDTLITQAIAERGRRVQNWVHIVLVGALHFLDQAHSEGPETLPYHDTHSFCGIIVGTPARPRTLMIALPVYLNHRVAQVVEFLEPVLEVVDSDGNQCKVEITTGQPLMVRLCLVIPEGVNIPGIARTGDTEAVRATVSHVMSCIEYHQKNAEPLAEAQKTLDAPAPNDDDDVEIPF